MSKVYIDGEIVDFQGPAPATAMEVWSLLEQFLGQSALLIENMRVDGSDWMPGENADSASYERIEAFSITQEGKVAQIVDELLGQGSVLEERWRNCAREVLSRPWTSFQNDGVELLNATQPLVQSLGVLVAYSKDCDAVWSRVLESVAERLNASLGLLLDAFEASDCVVFSDVAERGLLANVSEAFRILNDDVAPKLESGTQG